MCNLINIHTHIHTYIHTYPWEDQCEWHRMTRMTGPDRAVMCNLININAYIHKYIHTCSRALSLRNLVSGYECGRVFPAGVGPGSPSRDAAKWLPLRSDLSVETRQQYSWLRMVFSGVRLFRAPIWWPSGGWRHARGREYCRGEPGGSLSGGYAPDSAKAEGSSIVDEPGEG